MKGLPRVLRIIGLPGTFTDWGLALLGHIAGAAGVQLAVKPLADAAPDELAAPPAPGSAPLPVLVSHGADFRSDALAAAGGLRTIVFLDEPVAALREQLAAGQNARDAVRPLTAALAPLPPVLADAGTLLIQRTADLTGAAAAQAIAAHIGLAPGASRPAPPDPPPLADPGAPLAEDAYQLASRALLPLAMHVLGFDGGPITWPLACFYHGDRAGEAATEMVDLVGPSRVIVYGPYYHMPRGHWRVEVEVAFSDANSTFLVDVMTQEQLVKLRLVPERAGAYTGTFPLTLPRAEDRIEVRLWLQQGALEGQAGLHRVTFHPQPAA